MRISKDISLTSWKRLHAASCLVVAVLLFVVFGLLPRASASAEETSAPIDLSQTGSINVELNYGGVAVTGGTLTLCKVADVTVGSDGNFVYTYTNGFEGCGIELGDLSDKTLAQTLYKKMLALGMTEQSSEATDAGEGLVTTTTQTIGSDGKVKFASLPSGLYLVSQTTKCTGFQTIAPFLVSVPLKDESAWVYDVDATPKLALVREEDNGSSDDDDDDGDPTNESNKSGGSTGGKTSNTGTSSGSSSSSGTSSSTGSYLPQTGLQLAPVFALVIVGLVLFIVGWKLRYTEGKRKV